MTEAFLRWKRLLLPSSPVSASQAFISKEGQKEQRMEPYTLALILLEQSVNTWSYFHTKKYVQHCKYLLINRVMSDDRMNQCLSWLNQR